MEKLIPIVVALIGAAATIIAAKIKAGRNREQERAAEAKFAIQHPSTMAAPSGQAGVAKEQQVAVSLIFPGNSAFEDDDGRYSSTSVSYISVHVDGDRVGSGNGAKGFKIDFFTTVGMHDLVFRWEEDYARHSTGWSSSDAYRSEMEVVFRGQSACILRLGYDSQRGGFFIRRFEPRSAGYVPWSVKVTRYVLLSGIAAIVIGVLILWGLLSRG